VFLHVMVLPLQTASKECRQKGPIKITQYMLHKQVSKLPTSLVHVLPPKYRFLHRSGSLSSVPRNFSLGGVSSNSAEDRGQREEDLGAVAPWLGVSLNL
jgi:hypothetical protein